MFAEGAGDVAARNKCLACQNVDRSKKGQLGLDLEVSMTT